MLPARELTVIQAQARLGEGPVHRAVVRIGLGHRLPASPAAPASGRLREEVPRPHVDARPRALVRRQAQGAREAFLTSSTSMVLPVTRIDDQPVGDGRPGPVSRRLRSVYEGYMAEAPAKSDPARAVPAPKARGGGGGFGGRVRRCAAQQG